MHKTVGRSKLDWKELQEVLTDIETTLNNRLLTYIEKDIQFLFLTPNLLVLRQAPAILNEDPTDIENKDLGKRQKNIRRFKESAWESWRNEYLASLRKRYNLKPNMRAPDVTVGKVVVIKGDQRNKVQWKLGIITDVYPGKDDKARAVNMENRTWNEQYNTCTRSNYVILGHQLKNTQ